MKIILEESGKKISSYFQLSALGWVEVFSEVAWEKTLEYCATFGVNTYITYTFVFYYFKGHNLHCILEYVENHFFFLK